MFNINKCELDGGYDVRSDDGLNFHMDLYSVFLTSGHYDVLHEINTGIELLKS